MCNFIEILNQLDQKHLPIVCDEGVYRVARHIQLLHPEKFGGMIFMLGSLHMAKILESCIGKYLSESGADHVLVETESFGVNFVEQVLAGSNYARSMKGFDILAEALQRLQIEAFLKECGPKKYGDELSTIKALQEAFSENNPSECKSLHKIFVNNAERLIQDFQDPMITDRVERQVTNIMKYIGSRGSNPFQDGTNPLINLATKEIATAEAIKSLLNIFDNACEVWQEFCQKRFVNKSVSISDTISRFNLPNFKTPAKGDSNRQPKSKCLKEVKAAHKFLEIAKERNANSLKSGERSDRYENHAIDIQMIDGWVPCPKQEKLFWGSNENKTKLQEFLRDYCLRKAQEIWPRIQIICSGTTDLPCQSSKQSDLDILQNDHIEEADSRIILHVFHACSEGTEKILVKSSDTDIVVLLLHYWRTFEEKGLKELWMLIGAASKKRYLPLHDLAKKCGPICLVLIPLHHLTGADYTSRVGTKRAALEAGPGTHLTSFAQGIYMH
ncbi:hypothetical protein QAD02_016432 [Eretmocerus hayati]|uniref:Uncharacterized protein n=1 Tax=Eretmocerus hayati TaxID=131215 RepID=A0ACC2PB54_9HYME|nr:hypothetical protein QAD02_016432 [Eretmocerus hayati]